MATSEGLPESLTEFLEVWCADLLEPLTADQRITLVNDVHLTYGGGPWPRRLDVQRLAEIMQGVITQDAVAGELLELYGGGIDSVLARLRDPGTHASAVDQLGQLQATTEVVEKVTAVHRRGDLTKRERATILGRGLRLPLLPDPLPAPAHLVPVPDGYPEPDGEPPARRVSYRAARLVPALSSYVPQRARVDDDALDSLVPPSGGPTSGPWAPVRPYSFTELPDSPGFAVPFHDEADAFLRGRGWRSRRDAERGDCENDEWIWPPSESDPWWQPTIVDFDGYQFRVRLASASLVEAPHTDVLPTAAALRREIASIESWSSPPRER